MRAVSEAALPRWRRALSSEVSRSLVALTIAVVVDTVFIVTTFEQLDPQRPFRLYLDDVVLLFTVYQLVYVTVTLTVFARTSDRELARVASTFLPSSWVRRWVYLTEPGAGAALTVGVLAMVSAVAVLPRTADLPSRFSPHVLTALSLTLIITAWATMVLTYAVDYLRRDHQGGGLNFPGGGTRAFTDYLYFSVSVATTFGTTDVTVTRSELRRTVTGQALTAFAFNTVIPHLVGDRPRVLTARVTYVRRLSAARCPGPARASATCRPAPGSRAPTPPTTGGTWTTA